MNMPITVAAPSALSITEDEVIRVLQSSLYPGAAIASIKLVLGYCKAANLDPMQKPVHIVPMWDGKLKQMRDVIMPGVGNYRTQAARSGQYAGMTEPEFGPVIEDRILGSYPEWCRVTVKRIVCGIVVEFTAKEYWIENYATKGRDSAEPNAMWKKRPFGQIAKCAEAQALRKAFPETVSAEATAEEMEGKYIGGEIIDGSTGEVTTTVKTPQAKQPAPVAKKQEAEDAELVVANDAPPAKPATDSPKASAGQVKMMRTKAGQKGIAESVILEQFAIASLDDATVAIGNDIAKWIGEQP